MQIHIANRNRKFALNRIWGIEMVFLLCIFILISCFNMLRRDKLEEMHRIFSQLNFMMEIKLQIAFTVMSEK